MTGMSQFGEPNSQNPMCSCIFPYAPVNGIYHGMSNLVAYQYNLPKQADAFYHDLSLQVIWSLLP